MRGEAKIPVEKDQSDRQDQGYYKKSLVTKSQQLLILGIQIRAPYGEYQPRNVEALKT
jgi:hypothetical protein